MVTFGKIAQTKGKQLPLVIVNIPFIGYFIGTKTIENLRPKPFTRESVEVWDTEQEAVQALVSSTWTQASSCNIDGMD